MTENEIKVDWPELQVNDYDEKQFPQYDRLVHESGVFDLNVPIETWTSDASTHSLGYLTHNIFRYFGKFPPPIARKLIKDYSVEGDYVLDPMCGSGTTGLEAKLLGRSAHCYDINPLSVLVSKVKVSELNSSKLEASLSDIQSILLSSDLALVVPENPRINENWFNKNTIQSLARIKAAINTLSICKEEKDVFILGFLSTVRRVSKATTQQGRLFKDVKSAVENPVPEFLKRTRKIIQSLDQLPRNSSIVEVQQKSAGDSVEESLKEKFPLIICHPPYFNLYKYSTINSLELAWMDDAELKELRKLEIKEFFKVGRAENVHRYLEDMKKVLINLGEYLQDDGTVGFMNGDTIIRNEYIPVNKMLFEHLKDYFRIEKVALRVPKFTEASWAASQRRTKDNVGISLCDFVYILKKV
jgi:site-specific DNA-methyltransferase (cytosine-N4-specific)